MPILIPNGVHVQASMYISQGVFQLPEKDGVGDGEVEWCGISSSADSSVRCDEQQNS